MVSTKNIKDLSNAQSIGWADILISRLAANQVRINATTLKLYDNTAGVLTGNPASIDAGENQYYLNIKFGGTTRYIFQSNGSFTVGNNTGIVITPDTITCNNSSDRPMLNFNAADTLEQYRSTNAQKWQIYNTRTDSSNYERGFSRWASNVFEMGAEAAGTGTARSVRLKSSAGVFISSFGSDRLLCDHVGVLAMAGIRSNSASYNLGESVNPFGSLYLSGAIYSTGNSVVSTPLFSATGSWYAAGTSTTTKPHFLIEPTGTTSTGWSTSGTGLGVNASSGFVGNLIDGKINGTSKFTVGYDGTTNLAIDRTLTCGNVDAAGFVKIGSTLLYGNYGVGNLIEQRNGTAAQTLNIYNTYTDASNYERGFVKWNSNVFEIGTAAAGTGSSRAMNIIGGTTLSLYIGATLHQYIYSGGCVYYSASWTPFNSVVSTPASFFTGSWYTGGTSTTTKPHFLIEPSGATSTAWSTSGTGLGVNAASGFTGNLIDLQENGASYFRVDGHTQTICRGSLVTEYGNISINNGFLHFGGAVDVQLHRDAAATLALRNSTTAQAFNIYNTYTDASNYERGYIRWNSNVLEVGMQAAGTGSNRVVSFIQPSTTRWGSSTNSNVEIYQSNNNVAVFQASVLRILGTYHLGGSGTSDLGTSDYRWRDLRLQPSSSLTPTNNGELNIEATNNTTLTFKYKGSDGTVRSGTITLA